MTLLTDSAWQIRWHDDQMESSSHVDSMCCAHTNQLRSALLSCTETVTICHYGRRFVAVRSETNRQ
eukprot:scaffold12638_cov69-Cylindrotheca_fusiformis.AAC.4